MTGPDPAAQLVKNGYILLPGLIDPELCAQLATAILAVYSEQQQAGTLPDAPGVAAGNLLLIAGAAGTPLIDALDQAGVPALVERFAGRALGGAGVSGNLNLPGSRVQPFHIDASAAEGFWIVNVMLVDCGPNNGAIELIAGSHAESLSYWQLTRSEWRARRRQISAKQGDVLIRPSWLWHRGTSNSSTTPRPLAAVIYAAGPPAASFDGPIQFGGNRFYGRWARVKEAVAMRTPWLDEGLRLAGSLLKGPQ